MSDKDIWKCKIGEVDSAKLPLGADGPMREAIAKAYQELCGEAPQFIFSGWGATLTESERAVVEDRDPVCGQFEVNQIQKEAAIEIERLQGELRDLWALVDDLQPLAHKLGSWKDAADPMSIRRPLALLDGIGIRMKALRTKYGREG